jgi:biotin-dependent carboxylase-like uncharacterized protein
MTRPIVKVIATGSGVTLQDTGRQGWRRYGVPPSGPMDTHAASWANALLRNDLASPVLEIMLQGTRLEILGDVWLAVTGAPRELPVPSWCAVQVLAGTVLDFRPAESGIWGYLAVQNGFRAPSFFGSVSRYERGQLGLSLGSGTVLEQAEIDHAVLPEGVAARYVTPVEIRDYQRPPPLRISPGPQWEGFSERTRANFFAQTWTVSAHSDRAGYQLLGERIEPQFGELLSEPVRLGTIQIPGDGQPIVIMPDGPTVGGYPKLGLIAPGDLAWLAQCRPGQAIQFQLSSSADL